MALKANFNTDAGYVKAPQKKEVVGKEVNVKSVKQTNDTAVNNYKPNPTAPTTTNNTSNRTPSNSVRSQVNLQKEKNQINKSIAETKTSKSSFQKDIDAFKNEAMNINSKLKDYDTYEKNKTMLEADKVLNTRLEETSKGKYSEKDIIAPNKNGKYDFIDFGKMIKDIENENESYLKDIKSNNSYGTAIASNNYNFLGSTESDIIADNTKKLEQLKELKDYQEAYIAKFGYDWMKENASEEELYKQGQYEASYDDSWLSKTGRGLASSYTRFIGSVATIADIALELGDDYEAGKLLNSTAKDYVDGKISIEDYNKVADYVKSRLTTSQHIGTDISLAKTFMDEADFQKQLQLYGQTNAERLLSEAVISAVENLTYQAGGALLGKSLGVGAKVGEHIGTGLMSLSSFSTTLANDLAQRNEDGSQKYTTAQCLEHAGLNYITEFATELIGGERIVDMVTGESVAGLMLDNLVATATENALKSGISESVEEFYGWAVSPIWDWVALGEVPTAESWDSNELGEAISVAFISGAFMDTSANAINAYNQFFNITSTGGMTKVEAIIDQLKTLKNGDQTKSFYNGELTNDEFINLMVNVGEQQIYKYKNNSSLGGKVSFQQATDIDNFAHKLRQQAFEHLQPIQADLIKKSQNVQALANEMLNITNTMLEQNGINMMGGAEEYYQLSDEAKQNIKDVVGVADDIGLKVIFDSSLSLEVTDTNNQKHRYVIQGENLGENVIVINPNADDGIIKTLVHELTHSAELSNEYQALQDSVLATYSQEEYLTAYKKRAEQYFGIKSDNVTTIEDMLKLVTPQQDSVLKTELTAFKTQEVLGSMDFIDKLVKNNRSTAYRLFTQLSPIRSDAGKKIRKQMLMAYRSAFKNGFRGKIGDNTFTDSKVQMSLETYKSGGKELLREFLNTQTGLTNEDKEYMIDTMERIYKSLNEMAESGKYPYFAKWSETKFVANEKGDVSCVVTNGDYEMNIDFSTICKKRKMMDKVLNLLASQGFLSAERLNQADMKDIRRIIQENGLEVACAVCFVDSKRFNQGNWAGSFADSWNSLIDLISPNDNVNTIGKDQNEGFLDSLSDADLDQYGLRKLQEIAENQGNKEIGKMAKVILSDKSVRKYVDMGDMYGSVGLEMLGKYNDELAKIINSHYGAGKPKTPHTEVAYNNEIVNSGKFVAEKAKEVGGVRIQSFSDYMANMIFDYVQMVGDLSAKGMTAHSYTKVRDYALIFGQTGIKINLSIVPKATLLSAQEISKLSKKELAEVKKYAGLQRYTIEEVEAMDEATRTKLEKERGLGLSEDGKSYTAYIFDEESFDWLDALNIQSMEGYDKNVGTICIGASDEHIWKLLKDDNVKMVIPYHKSGINPIVAKALGINVMTDYTRQQRTRYNNGKKTAVPKKFEFDFYKGSDGFKGMIDNGYDAELTAKSYLAWCEQNDLVPKFDQFKNDPNYYKLLIDYRAKDINGEVAPQQAVTTTFPSNFDELVKNSLAQYEDIQTEQDKLLQPITEQIAKELNLKKKFALGDEVDNEDVGYHYGSEKLDYNRKSEVLRQRSGRGTGAFGTGTYFFGKDALNTYASSGYSDNSRLTEHKADFSNYNLFKVKNSDDGYRLHDYLKALDDNYGYEGYTTKAEWQSELDSLHDSLYDKYLDDEKLEDYEIPDIIDKLHKLGAMSVLAERNVMPNIKTSINFDGEEVYYWDEEANDIHVMSDAELAENIDVEWLEDRLGRFGDNWRNSESVEDYEALSKGNEKVASLLGISNDELIRLSKQAMESAKYDRLNGNLDTDSVGTRLMKSLGYEGIDVRGVKGLDTSSYGSVIYDLKPESVRYALGDEVITDTNNPAFYDYNNLIKLDDITLLEYDNPKVNKLDKKNYVDEFKVAVDNARKNGSPNVKEKSFEIRNKVDGRVVYANREFVKHAVFGSNNKETIIAIENIYDLLTKAIPVNKSTDFKGKDIVNYFSAMTIDGSVYVVRINVIDGDVKNVVSLLYATNAKKESQVGSTIPNGNRLLNGNSSTISVEDLLKEVNRQDEFKANLPANVQNLFNGVVNNPNGYTNKFSLGDEYGEGGYDGYSMSNRARRAYELGEMPRSKWTKTALLEGAREYVSDEVYNKLKKLDVNALRGTILEYAGWHHTSKFYNETNFYKLDTEKLSKMTSEDVDARIKQVAEARAINKYLDNATPEEREEYFRKKREEENARIEKIHKDTLQRIAVEKQVTFENSDSGFKEFFENYQKNNYEESRSGRIYPKYKKPSAYDYDHGLENFYEIGDRIYEPNTDKTLDGYHTLVWDGEKFVRLDKEFKSKNLVVGWDGEKYVVRNDEAQTRFSLGDEIEEALEVKNVKKLSTTAQDYYKVARDENGNKIGLVQANLYEQLGANSELIPLVRQATAEAIDGNISEETISAINDKVGNDVGETLSMFKNSIDMAIESIDRQASRISDTRNPIQKMREFLEKTGQDLAKMDVVKNLQNPNAQQVKDAFTQSAEEWIPNYKALSMKYDGTIDRSIMNDAIYEALIYGQISPATRKEVSDSIISNDFEYMYADSKYQDVVDQFISDTLDMMAVDVAYKAEVLNKSIGNRVAKILTSYQTGANDVTQDITEEFNRQKKGVEIELESRLFKKGVKEKTIDLAKEIINGGKQVGSDVLMGKTLSQVLDKVFGTNTGLRSDVGDYLEGSARKAQIDYLGRRNEANELIQKIVKDYGIRVGSKESEAVQWIQEKHTNKRDQNGRWESYDENKLRADFNYKMPNGKMAYENIIDSANLISDAYNKAIIELNKQQLLINGDVEGKNQLEIARLRTLINTDITTIEQLNEEMGRNITMENEATRLALEKRLNENINKYNSLMELTEDSDATRRHLTPVRKNYAHHVQKTTFANSIKRLKDASVSSNTPTALSGISNESKPNTAFAGFMASQQGGDYDADAIASFEAFTDQFAKVIAYNPHILDTRYLANNIRSEVTARSGEEGIRTQNDFVNWLDQYANNIAGKRTTIDRALDEVTNGKLKQFVNVLNGIRKGASLKYNVRSGLVQISNIPNGLQVLTRRGGKFATYDALNGVKLMVANRMGNGDLQSPFLNSRYFNYNDGDISLKAKADAIADFMMTAGDKFGAELIWHSAYAQAIRTKQGDPISYADDVTRRAVAGRGVGEVPLTYQSRYINFIAPFQVEVNNQWQTFKENVNEAVTNRNNERANAIGALIASGVGAYLVNQFIRALGLNDDVLADFITPLMREWKKYKDDDDKENETLEETILNMMMGELGELVSSVPGGSLAVGLTMDKDSSESLFGDYNPSRYGTENMLLGGFGDLGSDAYNYMKLAMEADEEGNHNLANGYLMKFGRDFVNNFVTGGTQAVRTIEGLEAMGGLPKYKGGTGGNIFDSTNYETSPIDYTDKGKIRYVNDTDNLNDWMRATLFGKWNTSQARDYVDNGFKTANTTTQNIFDAINDSFDTQYEAYKEAQKISKIEGLTDAKGNTISNSKAVQVRKEMEAIGVYDDIAEMIVNNKLDPNKYGLTKTIVGYDDSDFTKAYADIMNKANKPVEVETATAEKPKAESKPKEVTTDAKKENQTYYQTDNSVSEGTQTNYSNPGSNGSKRGSSYSGKGVRGKMVASKKLEKKKEEIRKYIAKTMSVTGNSKDVYSKIDKMLDSYARTANSTLATNTNKIRSNIARIKNKTK